MTCPVGVHLVPCTIPQHIALGCTSSREITNIHATRQRVDGLEGIRRIGAVEWAVLHEGADVLHLGISTPAAIGAKLRRSTHHHVRTSEGGTWDMALIVCTSERGIDRALVVHL